MFNDRRISDLQFHKLCGVVVLAAILSSCRGSYAQFAVGGVFIDAEGILRQTSSPTASDQLKQIRFESVAGPTSADISKPSKLRKISLARLQTHVARLRADGKPIPSEVQFLAGLGSIEYVFFYPDQNDVVLAGPAEGWQQIKTGEVVGRRSNRPALHLEDLVVALRSSFGTYGNAPFIGCSIDPTAEGVKNYARYVNSLGGFDRSRANEIFNGMANAMGMQSIRLFGIPASSRFSLKMVAADYRLKRIALGHDPAPVRHVKSYLDLAVKRSSTAARKQHRWWFVGDFDGILHTPDNNAFALHGQAVKVVTAPSFPTSQPVKSQKPSRSALRFAQSFSKHLPRIAEKMPIFAELQNLIQLAVAAELIAEKHKGSDKAANWKPNYFLDAEACPIQEFNVPTEVPSIANYRNSPGKQWVISVSGGVEIRPRELAGRKFRKESTNSTLRQVQEKSRTTATTASWWWD